MLSEYETKLAFEKLVETFPVTPWGRIDWGKVSSSIQFTSIVELKEILKNKLKDFSKEVFLLWNYSDAPVVRCDLFQALNVIDDVTAVGSDTWFF
ncbi:CDI toxin immunity protein [Cohnella rhizosphaerae]|uniref:CDI toxin immunity protein n=1 Tax=Cohnella rhizosphaerae TaxID=1457232 RepID=UPI003B8A6CF4